MPAADLTTTLLQIPGADKALGFLQDQLAAFAYLPTRLDRNRRALTQVRQVAATQNDAVKVAAAGALLDGVDRLNGAYAGTSAHVAAILAAIRGQTMSAPALVPPLLGVVADMSLLFRSMDAFEQATTDLEAGTLTADQIAALQGGGYTRQTAIINPLAKAAVWLFGLWLLGKVLRG